jgi:hypothetical protein
MNNNNNNDDDDDNDSDGSDMDGDKYTDDKEKIILYYVIICEKRLTDV